MLRNITIQNAKVRDGKKKYFLFNPFFKLLFFTEDDKFLSKSDNFNVI